MLNIAVGPTCFERAAWQAFCMEGAAQQYEERWTISWVGSLAAGFYEGKHLEIYEGKFNGKYEGKYEEEYEEQNMMRNRRKYMRRNVRWNEGRNVRRYHFQMGGRNNDEMVLSITDMVLTARNRKDSFRITENCFVTISHLELFF